LNKLILAFAAIALLLCLSSIFTFNDEKPTVTFQDMTSLPVALDSPIRNEP
jgi:hypothetical protein